MTDIDGITDTFVKDMHSLVGKLSTASTKKRVRLLEVIAVTAECVVNQIKEDLEFERTLEIFNHHGALATKPFGAIPIGDRGVLVSNYTDSRGSYWNGSLLHKGFIINEVEARWGWAEMEAA